MARSVVIDFAASLVIGLCAILAATPPASAAEYPCKHNTPTSDIECRPRQPAPWEYQSEGYSSPVVEPKFATEAEALDWAFEHIPDGYSAYCRYDYQWYDPPWTVRLSAGDFTTSEMRYYVVRGWVYSGTYCQHGRGQDIHTTRARTIFCPASWWQTYDGLGSVLCLRDQHSTPPLQCRKPCTTGGPSNSGTFAGSYSWMGNPIFAHTGDKFQSEHDYSSGGFKPLTLSRNYLSSSFPRLIRTTYRHFGLGDYWRTSFDLRMQTYTGTTVTSKIFYRPDGSTRYFYQNGSTWTSRAEQSETLANIVVGGVTTGWRLTLADSTVEEYDLQGRAVAIIDPSGWRQDLAYNANDLLSTVTDSLGRQLAFAYDAEGWLVSVTTPDGQITFEKEPHGYLASVTYPGGAQRRYKYMEAGYSDSTSRTGLLTGIIDENGSRYATFRYNSAGVGWSTELGNGANRYTFSIGSTTIVTDPLGTARTVAKTVVKGFLRTVGLSQACPTCAPEDNISTSTFDANGNVASRTFFTGKKTCYAYDTTRNLETARLEGATSAENCTTVLATPPNRPDVRKVTTTWNATWRLPATIAEPAPGGTKTTTFTYDASGNLIQKSITAPKNDGSGTTITRTWSWTYATYGRVLTATDPNGRVTTTTYHADNDPDIGKRGQVATVTNPVGHVTQYT
ncbi:MAG: DUF6531 domain-containing protein, partial [Burkholderiales bacterium]